MGALLLLLVGYFWLPPIRTGMRPFSNTGPPGAQPLAGKDSISGLEVKQTAPGVWTAEFNYFYTGAPSDTQLFVELTPAAGTPAVSQTLLYTPLFRPQRGSHHSSVELRYPGMPQRTVRVTARMRRMGNGWGNVTSQQLDQVIDWPDFETWALNQRIATRSPEDNLKQAQMLIDSGDALRIRDAKLILEKLLEQNPKFAPAYTELARIALKTNWGPEGLHQAEGLLATALQLQPDNTDAKVLLAYVYAHQGHFTKADALFKTVATTATNNLWLWSNWGEMFEMEHRADQAIAKYRQVIAHPMTHDRNDRARDFAYEQLLGILRDRKDFDGMETLYKQRVAEFGWGSCYSAEYTRFLLQVRGNIDGAIDSARRALNQRCDDTPSRELLGLAEYAKWAASKGSPRLEALNQARIFLPMGARALYLLASSERTVGAARQQVAAGEPIDQKDNDNLDALAYALQNRDLDAVRRLLALGARAETPIGGADMPVALLPVLDGDVADVRLMRSLGVHYSSLRFRGVTALDFAKQQGNQALLTALGIGNTAL
ncbi:MAG: tetratricopeptide repeat protein [Steroidobacteraceae bacterium]